MTTAEPAPAPVRAAAARLAAAARDGVPCAPVRDLIGRDDLDAAYAVQQILTAERTARGARVVGRKIGLTSEAVQRQLSVDQPDFGMLFDDTAWEDGATVPYDSVLQPRVEAEVAFLLKADLAEGPLDTAQVRAPIDVAAAALEVCGSRIENWDISLADTVADNASAGGYVLGPVRRPLSKVEQRLLAEFEPRDVTMQLAIGGETVATGHTPGPERQPPTDIEPRDVTMQMTIDGETVATGHTPDPERQPPTDIEPRDVTMQLAIGGETVATGTGAACLGDPIKAVVWLARRAREYGEPLRAGQVVLSGALGPMRPVGPGSTVRAEISGLGAVSVSFSHRNGV